MPAGLGNGANLTHEIEITPLSKSDSLWRELEGRNLVYIDIYCECCKLFTQHTLLGFRLVKTHRELVYKCPCGQERAWGVSNSVQK